MIVCFCTIACLGAGAQKRNNKAIEQLNEIEQLYARGDHQAALKVIKPLVHPEARGLLHPDATMRLLRWKIRIHYQMLDMARADSSLIALFEVEGESEYDKFPDKTPHFSTYFEQFYQAYNQDFVFVNKRKENKDAAPAVITVYKQKDIRAMGARNLMDLLKVIPGFVEIGDSDERNFGTRGVYGTTVQHVLFLINGHRINDLLTSSASPDWISLDYVQQVEVMQGPGSALYGGNAFSGIVNIITKSGRSFQKSAVEVGLGSANLGKHRTGTDWKDHQYRVNYQLGSVLKGNTQLYFSGTIFSSGGSKFDDYTDEDPAKVYPDIPYQFTDSVIAPNYQGLEYINKRLPGYNVLFTLQSKNFQLTVNAQSNTMVLNRPFSQNLWSQEEYFVTEFYDTLSLPFSVRSRQDKREFIQISFTPERLLGLRGDWSLKGSFDHFQKSLYTHDYTEIFSEVLSFTRLRGDEYRFNTELQYSTDSWSWFNQNKNSTLIGVQGSYTNWFYDYMDINAGYTLIASPARNYFPRIDPVDSTRNEENIGAFFFQSSQHLINDELILTTGFRLNYHSIYANFNHFDYGEEFSPRVSMVYLPKKKSVASGIKSVLPNKYKLLYNSAFLPPAFLYRNGGIWGFNGSFDLTSQTMESIEFSTSGKLTSNLEYTVGGYMNRIKHFIKLGEAYAWAYDSVTFDYFYEPLEYIESMPHLVIEEVINEDSYSNETGNRLYKGLEIGLTYDKTFTAYSLEAFVNASIVQLSRTTEEKITITEVFGNTDFRRMANPNYPSYTGNTGFTVKLPIGQSSRLILHTQGNFWSSVQTSPRPEALQNPGRESVYIDLAQFQNSLPARAIFNMNIGYQTTGLALNLSVHNLLNTSYFLPNPQIFSGVIRAEKRTFMLNASIPLSGG